MGSLAWSYSYEREQERLPPVDLEHTRLLSERRTEAYGEMDRHTEKKLEDSTVHASRDALRLRARERAYAKMEMAMEGQVSRARQIHLHTSSSPHSRSAPELRPPTRSSGGRGAGGGHHGVPDKQIVHEAVRETARDCVRREELHRRRALAERAEADAKRRVDALDFKRREEAAKLAIKEEEERQLVRKLAAREESRLTQTFSTASLREDERKTMMEIRATHENHLKAERDRRAQQREQALAEKKVAEEIAEVEKEMALAARKRDKERLRQRQAANKAEENHHKAEQVRERGKVACC